MRDHSPIFVCLLCATCAKLGQIGPISAKLGCQQLNLESITCATVAKWQKSREALLSSKTAIGQDAVRTSAVRISCWRQLDELKTKVLGG